MATNSSQASRTSPWREKERASPKKESCPGCLKISQTTETTIIIKQQGQLLYTTGTTFFNLITLSRKNAPAKKKKVVPVVLHVVQVV